MNSNSIRLPVGGKAPQLAQMGTSQGFAGRDQIPFGDLLVDRHRGVRKALKQRAVERFEAGGGTPVRDDLPSFWPVVIHEPGVEHLIGEGKVVPARVGGCQQGGRCRNWSCPVWGGGWLGT